VNRKIFEEIHTELKYFNPKIIVLKLSEVMVGSGIRDPDPEKNLFRIPDPDPGSRGPKGTGSRIPDPDPQHWEPERIQI